MENKPTFIPYVYKVTNKITGHFYIGMKAVPGEIGIDYFTSSSNLEFRKDFQEHPENYLCEKLFEGELKTVAEKEGELIRESMQNKLILNKAFQCNGKIHYNLDCHRSVETRKKISEARKGKKMSLEARQKMSKSRKGRTAWNKGIKYSEDQKKNLKGFQKGYKVSMETRLKRSEALKGRTFSSEWKSNLSKAWEIRKAKGLACTEATREKMRKSHARPGSNTKGKHWYTNGKVNTLAYECPNGFWKGHAKQDYNNVHENTEQ